MSRPRTTVTHRPARPRSVGDEVPCRYDRCFTAGELIRGKREVGQGGQVLRCEAGSANALVFPVSRFRDGKKKIIVGPSVPVLRLEIADRSELNPVPPSRPAPPPSSRTAPSLPPASMSAAATSCPERPLSPYAEIAARTNAGTGADVLALGTQGRRVRLLHLFTPPPIVVSVSAITLST
jgi:hypothetical protein